MGSEGFSTWRLGSTGTKVWLRRSDGKIMGRLKLKVCVVSELLGDSYHTGVMKAAAKSDVPIVFPVLSA